MTGAMIAISLVLIVVSGVTISLVAYFRLQRHRADAVAMASYRKLAEEATGKYGEITEKLTELNDRIASVEKLLRSVE